jgi:ATP-binding cassette subfamily F protein 3
MNSEHASQILPAKEWCIVNELRYYYKRRERSGQMLVAHNLTKSQGTSLILKDVSFVVNVGDRVGLIGPNGSGKTSLLRLLIGQSEPDSGHVSLTPPDLRVGYLAQGFEPDPDQTITQVLHEEVGDPGLLEAELQSMANALAADPKNLDFQAAYDETLTKLSHHEMGRLQSTLASLGLDEIDDSLPVGKLSGGLRTRLALALVLLKSPDLLLLDEPTNHLDMQMLQWLENWLREFPGGVLIVSHDRLFLDHTVDRILDLDPLTQTIRQYAGSYSDYLEQYLSEREKQMAAYKEQVYEIRRMRRDIQRTMEQARWVERSTTPRQPNVRRYAKKVARKAKSRERKLERFLDSGDRVQKPSQSWQMKLELDGTPHLGRDVLTMEELAVGFRQQQPLLVDVNQDVQTGQRIAFSGPNGGGKTTLLRTIAGHLEPLAGSVRLGASVRLGYMAQEQELLKAEMTPLDTILRATEMNHTEARSFLHFFLFSGDEPLRLNRVLSFGERARLALALLVAQGCNFLLLDEPINHLDIPSRERFEQALAQFDGTILAVVHDRYFVTRFATDLWLVEDHRIRTEILRR